MEKISTDKAPKALGPYSQAIKANGFIFVSGQLPIDPTTDKMIEGGIDALTRRVLQNLKAVLEKGGSSLDKVVRVDIFLKDLKRDFAEMNKEYALHFGKTAPARQTIQAAELPLGSLIEISCIAVAN